MVLPVPPFTATVTESSWVEVMLNEEGDTVTEGVALATLIAVDVPDAVL